MAYFLIQEYKLTDFFGKCLVTANCLSALIFLSLIEDGARTSSSPTQKILGQRSIYLYLFLIRRSLIFLDLTFICTYIYIHIDMCVYTHTYIYIYLIHISMFIHTYIHVCVCSQSCLTLCDPIDCSPLGSSVHEIFQVWNTGAGCHFCLQGIFPTQGLNLCLLHLQADSLPLCHLRSPCTYIHTHKQTST